ncbi:MAG: UDP-N-acetylmuramoyl-L-alanyl-D-glutamate--2,6-diaminopimelate ligase [Candidatus Omnitrophica bacterium]|nr:UDP-N-acetylmuramoyl-L-alanyl-D-glutamate--2,6-diaminopimelate ligase [Candidatus Omnitrophota bacterium]
MKNIDELLEKVSYDANRIKIDSRGVNKGDIFIALKGTAIDGRLFVDDAIKAGAERVIAERGPGGVTAQERIIEVDNAQQAFTYVNKRIFEKRASSLSIFGITGTNGKTTTVFMIYDILRRSGIDCGLLGTVCNITGKGKISPSALTTPGGDELNRYLQEISANGCKYTAMELSSHALEQGRASGISVRSAVFTNITPEHLDYHHNMKEYLKSKSKIFELVADGGHTAINIDDAMIATLKQDKRIKGLVTFSIENEADVTARDIKLSRDGSEFLISSRDFGEIDIRTDLVGRHNVYNSLSAASALLYSGIPPLVIKKGLESGIKVPGRLEKIRSGKDFDVYVDYAHTPNALLNVLECLKGFASGQLICVFGCGGNRDKEKRPVMGKIATDIADRVIVTDDNPRREKSDDIVKDIEKGICGKDNYCIIRPREEAIAHAVRTAAPGDVIIIAGKGHEDYQIIGDTKFDFSDIETVNRLLQN